jgi:hypothetical protein
MKKLKCPACGSPCREILATSVAGCENPRCRFFDGAEVLEMMRRAEELLRDAGLVGG